MILTIIFISMLGIIIGCVGFDHYHRLACKHMFTNPEREKTESMFVQLFVILTVLCLTICTQATICWLFITIHHLPLLK